MRPLDGKATAQLEDGLKAVLAEAFAEPPYGEGRPDDIDRAFRRFRSQTRKAGFLATVAVDQDGQVVGMTYGYRSRRPPGGGAPSPNLSRTSCGARTGTAPSGCSSLRSGRPGGAGASPLGCTPRSPGR